MVLQGAMWHDVAFHTSHVFAQCLFFFDDLLCASPVDAAQLAQLTAISNSTLAHDSATAGTTKTKVAGATAKKDDDKATTTTRKVC